MSNPKIKSVKVIDNHTLEVLFTNNEIRVYDVLPLLKKEMFQPLINPALFKNVKVETGGYALVWNENIDISEYEVWRNGKPMPQNKTMLTSIADDGRPLSTPSSVRS